METKKSKSVSLENHRRNFFLVGLVVAIGVVITAFNWATEKSAAIGFDVYDKGVEIEQIPIIKNEIEMPKQEKIKPQQILTEILITDDDEPTIEPFELTWADDLGDDIIYTDDNINEEPIEETPLVVAQHMPEFPGLRQYLANHVKYPVIARENDIEGTVYVQFVVNKRGEVTQVKILRGADELLDKEALRVVNELPNFKPGMQNGKPVSVYFTLPIAFKLN